MSEEEKEEEAENKKRKERTLHAFSYPRGSLGTLSMGASKDGGSPQLHSGPSKRLQSGQFLEGGMVTHLPGCFSRTSSSYPWKLEIRRMA